MTKMFTQEQLQALANVKAGDIGTLRCTWGDPRNGLNICGVYYTRTFLNLPPWGLRVAHKQGNGRGGTLVHHTT